jgi:hypothetical protein
MTLDEAIKRYTDNAEYERTHGNLQGCMDFKQLAEWLKELEKLKEKAEPQIVHYVNDREFEDDADVYCPNCDELLNDYWSCGYCPCCGQALEW